MVLNKEDKEYIDRCIKPVVGDIMALKEDTKLIYIEMNQRVTYKMFFSVVGILVSILIGLFGFIAYQIQDLQAKTYFISQDVARIGAILENIEFINLD